MCGILGLFDLRGGPLPAACAGDLAVRALHTLRHRGPDDQVFWRAPGVFLGATRLALVDPEGGRQPVRDESGRLHLIMNGELFPDDALARGLRARGHSLRSRCDTELAVHLFEERWSGALEDLDGQYALAVHDGRERRLLLARDRMGICPLHYAVVGDVLVFASEPKALFATGLLRPRLDPHALDAVLAFGCLPPPQTAWEGVRALPPGTFLEARDGAVRVVRYWDHPYPAAGEHRPRSVDEAAEELRALLAAAVRRRLRADAPVGLFLSGGLDSLVVAALAVRGGARDLRAYVLGFPEAAHDERAKARAAAAHLGLPLEEVVSSQADLAAAFPEHVFNLESPLIVTNGAPREALARRAAQDVKAVLTGAGADELLGGYDFFALDHWRRRVEEGPLAPVLGPACRAALGLWLGSASPVFPTDGDRAWSSAVFGFHPAYMVWMSGWRSLREQLYSPRLLERPEALTGVPPLDFPFEAMRRWEPLDRSLYVTSRLWLTEHGVGSIDDRTAMAASLEARHPFLDRHVQEFVAGVAPAVKWHPFASKLLLRRAMRGLVPAAFLAQPKQGFLAPMGTPFVGPGAPDWARELLARPSLERAGWFEPARVEAAAQRLGRAKERLGAGASPGAAQLPSRQRLACREDGKALTFVLSVQLLDHFVREGRFSPARLTAGAPAAGPAEVA